MLTTRRRLPNLGLRISERRLLLAAGDLLLINAALVIALLLRSYGAFDANVVTDAVGPGTIGHDAAGYGAFSLSALLRHWPWFLVFNSHWYAATVFFQLYDLRRAANALPSALAAGGAVLIVGTAYLLIPFIAPQSPRLRFYFYLLPLLLAAAVALWRLLYATLIVQPVFRRTALIVGAGQSGRALLQAINRRHDRGHGSWSNTVYQVLGFVDDDPHKQQKIVDGSPVLGSGADLLRLVQKLQPDEIILAITAPHTIEPDLFQDILTCREMGAAVTPMAHLYEELTGRVAVQHAGRDLSVVLPIVALEPPRYYLFLRRLLDLLAAILGCLLLLLVIPLLWLANRLFSSGDLFYRQQRVGRAGKPFTIVKFRSMVMDAEGQSGAVWAVKNDSRITTLGRFLRKTRLDELPQFWNILKGDMSLIGPRPERPDFIAGLSRQIPFYRLRHAVKPGLTGWAQVQYPYGASVEDALVKLQYDLYYNKRQSPYLDLVILLKTVQVMLGLRGR